MKLEIQIVSTLNFHSVKPFVKMTKQFSFPKLPPSLTSATSFFLGMPSIKANTINQIQKLDIFDQAKPFLEQEIFMEPINT